MSQERKIAEEERLRETPCRLDNGLYGVCAECNKTIPEARLRAIPEATRCVDCQSKLEQRSAA